MKAVSSVDRAPLAEKGRPVFRLKIGILDDHQGVALSLADWSSLDADVEVFTAPFVDANEVVKQLAELGLLSGRRRGHRRVHCWLSRSGHPLTDKRWPQPWTLPQRQGGREPRRQRRSAD
jgi:hypothetical protein